MKQLCFYLLIGLVSFSPALEAKKKPKVTQKTKVSKKQPKASEGVMAESDKAEPKELEKAAPEQVSPEQVSPEEATHDISFTGKDAFDAEKKRNDVVAFVKKSKAFLEQNSLIEFLRRINHTLEFNEGELYLVMYDDKGVCIAHGQYTQFLWKNLIDQKDVFGNFFVKKILKIAEMGGGFVAYEWHASTKIVYVQPVEKDGKKYALCCGYYPHTKEDAVVSLVRGAVATFYRYVDRGASPEEAFGDFSFPGGKFISGELYIYVLDEKAVIRANGFDPLEIGVNYWDEKDPQGNYYLRNIVQTLADRPITEGHWFDFEYYNAPERDYAERVVDKKGNSYCIVCGYNPYAGREKALELTTRAIKSIKERGLTPVVNVINDISNQEFVYGRMTIFIYDAEGNVIANGERPTLAGKNIINERDESGAFFIQEIIQQTLKNKTAWVSYLLKKAITSVYAEELILDGKTYIVGTSFFPMSKASSTVQLVKSAKLLLQKSSEAAAFRSFGDYEGTSVSGDLTVFVYGLDGTCYANGFEVVDVWRNMLSAKDDEGRLYVKTMINVGKSGPAKVSFKKNNARMVAYVEPVQKGNKTFIIGSGYYL